MSSALIIVDLQNDYFPGGAFPLHNVEEASKNATKVLEHARANNLPVFHIQHLSADPTKIPFFLPETTGAEIHQSVKPANNENEVVIQKYYPNSFLKTDLKQLIDDKNITNLTIIGAMSQMCIEATTRAAADFGYNCVVVHDACAAPNQQFNGVDVPAAHVHATAMSALAFGYAKIVSTEEHLQ